MRKGLNMMKKKFKKPNKRSAGLMDQIMNREKITKESFMANMVKAFKPPEESKTKSKNGKFKRRGRNVSFMSLISAGIGKGRKKRKYQFLQESETQEELNGMISRATQTRNKRDNITKDGKMKPINKYERADLTEPELIQDGIALWIESAKIAVQKKKDFGASLAFTDLKETDLEYRQNLKNYQVFRNAQLMQRFKDRPLREKKGALGMFLNVSPIQSALQSARTILRSKRQISRSKSSRSQKSTFKSRGNTGIFNDDIDSQDGSRLQRAQLSRKGSTRSQFSPVNNIRH